MIKAYNISANFLEKLNENTELETTIKNLPLNFWFDFKLCCTTIDVYKIEIDLFEITICTEGIQNLNVNSKELKELINGEKTLFTLFNNS